MTAHTCKSRFLSVKLVTAAVAALAVLGVGAPPMVPAFSAEQESKPAAVDGLKATLCVAPVVLACSDECRASRARGPEHPCAGGCGASCEARFQMCWGCAANAGLCQMCGKKKLPAGTLAIKEFKVGETVALGVCLENVSTENLRICNYMFNMSKLKWAVTGPDAESVLPVKAVAAIDAHLTGGHFPELAPGGKRMFAVRLAGNPPCIDQITLKTYLLKPGDYKISATYSNQDDSYYDGRLKLMVHPAGRVWKGEVKTGSLAVKITGDFQLALPARSRMLGG